MTEYRRINNGEWSGLYVDGKLIAHGDNYIVDEKIEALLGVVSVDGIETDDWLIDSREPFRDLHVVLERRDRRVADERSQRAAALREQAATLLAAADALLEES